MDSANPTAVGSLVAPSHLARPTRRGGGAFPLDGVVADLGLRLTPLNAGWSTASSTGAAAS